VQLLMYPVWHTLCMIDEWSSTGLQISRQITKPPIDIPLPMEEMAFLQLRNEDKIDATGSTGPPPAPSLLGRMIALSRIFADINQINREAVDTHLLPPDTEAIKSLAVRLDAWESQLPPYMRDDPSNLAHYAAQGLGRIYVAVYGGYYHYGQLLYYQYLHGSRDEDGSVTNTLAKRCKYFSAQLCNVIYASLETPGCDVLYNMIGHVLVIASTVQIHTLLFSSDAVEIAAAKDRLERNFKVLLKLRDLWPSLDVCMIRLQTFNKACRTSMETSFKLDRWMLKFLSEFAKPVYDRPSGSENPWAIGDISVTPASDFGIHSITYSG